MLGPFRKVYPLSGVGRILDLHFSQMKHLVTVLDSLNDSLQSRLAQFDAMEGAVGSLLLNDAATLAAMSELLSARIKALEEQTARTSDIKNLELQIQGCIAGFAAANNQSNRLEVTANAIQILEERNREELVARIGALEEQTLDSLRGIRTELTDQVASIREEFRNCVSEAETALGDLIRTARAAETKEPIIASLGANVSQESEIALLEYLFAFLPNRNAIDVGANVGNFSCRLLEAGYNVSAFEPYPPAFQRLQGRFGANPDFHALSVAIGPADGTMDLHIAADRSGEGSHPDPTLYNSLVDHSLVDGLQFTSSIPVQIRSLESLRASGEIPERASLLKIDTEGFDLQVLRGMGSSEYSVVMTEFWDASHPFGESGAGRLKDLVKEMRGQHYPWYLVMYHIDHESTVSFYCNRAHSMPGSWGNVLFFRDSAIFHRARRWCEAILRPTLFR